MNITDYEPGFYYAARSGFGEHDAIPETIIRVTPDKRIVDTHNLLTEWYDYEILGPVPRLCELESLSNATVWNPVAEQTPRGAA